MSRKHFEKIATTLKAQLDYAEDVSSKVAVEDTARALTADFYYFNPNFQRGRFLRACGVGA